MSNATKLSDYIDGIFIESYPIVLSAQMQIGNAQIRCPHCGSEFTETISIWSFDDKNGFEGPTHCSRCGGSLLKEDNQ